jgi:hypothetical protein
LNDRRGKPQELMTSLVIPRFAVANESVGTVTVDADTIDASAVSATLITHPQVAFIHDRVFPAFVSSDDGTPSFYKQVQELTHSYRSGSGINFHVLTVTTVGTEVQFRVAVLAKSKKRGIGGESAQDMNNSAQREVVMNFAKIVNSIHNFLAPLY